MSAADIETATAEGLSIQIDENRRVCGCIREDGSIYFDFWNGNIRSSIALTDEAFLAAIKIFDGLKGER